MHKKTVLGSVLCAALISVPFATSVMAALPSARIVKQNAAPVQTDIPNVVPFSAIAPTQPEKGKVVNFTLEAKRAKMEVQPGVVKEVWTFNGQVPAPTLRVNQGDTVHLTVINKDPQMAHGIDIHAGQMDMATYHKPINPGESETFDFVANFPGVFYYHCSADPVMMHIANGMFGAVIVDPPGYKPLGKEYVLIQNEWYKNLTDMNELMTGDPVAMAFNGFPSQYMKTPLTASAGENIRFYFVNAGINHFSAFHVIGTIFDRVLYDGNPQNAFYGEQTVAVPPGGAIVTDLAADKGTYAILTHSMKDATLGALGLLQVGDAKAGSSAAAMPAMPAMNMPAPTPAPAPAPTPAAAPAQPAPAATPAQAGDSAATIHMGNFAFSPASLTVKAGTTVTWVNDDTSNHTVVSDGNFDSSKEKPDGMAPGESFSHTFSTPGTFAYHCSIHPFMTGTITVN